MNKIKNHLTLLCLCISLAAQAQRLGIGTSSPDASAVLEIAGTDGGVLIPRMTTAQRNAIVTPATGLIACSDNQIFRSVDNGVTWTSVFKHGDQGNFFRLLVSGKTIYALLIQGC